MANSEGSFKAEFKRDLRLCYGKPLHMWSHTDWSTVGLPDMALHDGGVYVPIEVKFVVHPPVRDVSKLLKRELTATQYEHLLKSNMTGGSAHVLIGFSDIAVLVPFAFWPENECNVTFGFVKKLAEDHLELVFKKGRGGWSVGSFLEVAKKWKPL